MRLKTSEKVKPLVWYKWFAWYPVNVNYSTIVWLERIERMYHHDFLGLLWSEYRLINDESK